MRWYAKWLGGWALSFCLWSGVAQALPPETAPEPVKTFVRRLEETLNQRSADAVLQLYSPNFTHADGLNRDVLAQSLTRLWQRFPNLTYRAELLDWQPREQGFVADVQMTLRGTETQKNRQFDLTSVLKTRQTVVQGQIQRQEILSEQTQLTSGKEPPQVTVTLPEVVAPSQTYEFDVIVQEPLQDDQILGTAVATPVQPEQLLENPRLKLEVLSSGGLFKMGQAPATPGSQWLSAVLVRQGGITIITRRLRVATP
ncbi:MAG: nuclear transport factor 2 family protein [Gloeomargarita sp. SKYBB_i_bin120]|nr:nuclear transport factor 2 family protein [Gloeomargarita sp. SKYB120]MDW8178600.1 nuclear transport factor 2 family protein [Gloeomargarita sp. SKYBB_i_bin120]